jgi:drug/metabolite transporter (DMT)-like permease
MVNYLWPSLTIVLRFFQRSKINPVGDRLSCAAGRVLGIRGRTGITSDEITRNIVSSPLSYALAFAGAFIWAAYCTVTSNLPKGKTASPCLFC